MSSPGSSRLPCGAAVDDLLEQVATGRGERDSHQRSCPHCGAALAELAALWAPVLAAASAHLPVVPGLAAGVMQLVRRVAADTWWTLDITGGGAVRVAARVVALVARDAARAVPGVRAALGRSTEAVAARRAERASLEHLHPHAAVGVLGRTAAVEVALAVELDGRPVRATAAQVQGAVVRALQRDIGLRDVVVNVTVDDVLPRRR